MNDLKYLCSHFSDIECVQGAGGNISKKCGEELVIKASGSTFADHEFAKLLFRKLEHIYTSGANEEDYRNVVEKNSSGKPSMEAGFHSFLDTYVVHLHPLHMSVLLCSHDARTWVDKLCPDTFFHFIPYVKPGHSLAQKMFEKTPRKPVYFLENHGVVVSHNNVDACKDIADALVNRAKTLVEEKVGSLRSYGEPFFNGRMYVGERTPISKPLFPDAAVFSTTAQQMGGRMLYKNLKEAKMIDEVVYAQNIVAQAVTAFGGGKVLTDNEIAEIIGMPQEQYRKKRLK